MDRNTIIGIVLVLVIFLAWPKWMQLISGRSERNRPAPTTEVADTTGAARTGQTAIRMATDTAGAAIARPAPVSTPAETIRAREIVIETSKLRAVLSNRGAVLRQISLKNFHTHDGDPVVLLPRDGYGMGLVVGEARRSIDLTSRMFQTDADRERYTVAPGDSATIGFRATLSDGREVYKRYTFRGDRYTVGFATGFADTTRKDRVALTWYGEVPHEEDDPAKGIGFMKAQSLIGDELETVQIKKEPAAQGFRGSAEWVGIRNKYFFTGFAPSYDDPSEVRLQGTGLPPASVNYGWQIVPLDFTETRIRGELYLGPIDVDLLTAAGHGFERAADLGWTFIRPISKVVLWTFSGLYKVFRNYGVVIIVFSVIVSIVLYPLTKKSYESTSKMQRLKPLMDEIRAKYKDDQTKLNQEMIRLYKEEGFNPLGGCLPMVLQMPIIFAIYAVLSNYIEFRQAPFALWIDDLSRPDTVFTLPFAIPFYGRDINVLPVLMAASMFIQQKLTLTDPKQKMLIYLMPVMMLFIFNNLSSGLVLYWFMFNVISSARQYWLTRKQREEPIPALASARSSGTSTAGPKSPMKKRRR